MAVTHADLAIGLSGRSLGSKLGNGVMVLCTFLGLLAFIFCLIAETTRSEADYVPWTLSVLACSHCSFDKCFMIAIWMLVEYPNRKSGTELKCMYTSRGTSPILSGLGGLVSLGMAVGIQQAYIWIALCYPPATDRFHPLDAWTSNAISSKSLRWQAASFFIFSWICVAVAAVLLLIGIGVEAGHTRHWSMARTKCLVIRQGMFAAAGVFGLSATSLGVAFYVTALQTRRLQEEEANVRQEVLEATLSSAAMEDPPQLHGTPATSPESQTHHQPLAK